MGLDSNFERISKERNDSTEVEQKLKKLCPNKNQTGSVLNLLEQSIMLNNIPVLNQKHLQKTDALVEQCNQQLFEARRYS